MFDQTIKLPGFGSWFKKKKTRCVGVDIGSSSVKAVELERKGSEIALKNYAYTKTNKKDLIKPGSQKVVSEDVGEVIKKAFEEAEIKTKDINISLPSFASLITTIELPPSTEKEIEQIIQVEAPKYIPVPLKEVVYGWQVINRDGQSKEAEWQQNFSTKKPSAKTRKKVLLVSVMKSISTQYEKVLKKAGFNINSLEVDVFALNRALGNFPDKSFLLIDAGSNITSISIVSNDNIVINRSIDIGGERLTELLSESMGISRQRAEKIKKNQGLNVESSDIKKQILKPLFDNIIEESGNAIEAFNKNYSNLASVDSIMLTGGLSQMKGFDSFLEKELSLEVQPVNTWSKINFSEEISDSLEELSPFFGVAAGLALKDLTGEEIIQDK